MQKILVVGGAGFVGSHVNKLLRESGYETIIFDKCTTDDQDLVVGDIGDSVSLDRLFQEHSFDAVMHFAALINIAESMQKPTEYYRNNLVNTINLLNCMLKHGIKKIIFSSSASVYGIPFSLPIPESHPLNPIHPYGRSKYMVEQILEDYSKAYGLKVCSLRYFNAAGGDPKGKFKQNRLVENNLIPILLKNIQHQLPTTIFGTDYPTPDGTCIRDYIHVSDLATAHLLSLENALQSTPTVYNLGTRQGASILEVIHTAERVTGRKCSVKMGARRTGDPPILVADPSKAEKELGWRCRYPDLETIISHAWQAIY